MVLLLNHLHSVVPAVAQTELGKLVLKRLLLLVLIMDRAADQLSKQHCTPLLFKLAGGIKSSKQVHCWRETAVQTRPNHMTYTVVQAMMKKPHLRSFDCSSCILVV